jgi:futalosine hydrolase
MILCAATLMELDACLGAMGMRFRDLPPTAAQPWRRTLGKITYAVTGVGIPLTMSRLLPLIAVAGLAGDGIKKPALIFNLGIAGAYPGSGLAIGDVVAGESEVFGDLGMESPGGEAFLPLTSFAWADAEYRAPLKLALDPLLPGPGEGTGVRTGRGCTVNACTGREETGKLRRTLFQADFETMEGAAVAWIGREAGIPVCEVRAISNHASTRDFRPANVDSALSNLGVYLGGWLGRNA